MTTEHKKLYYSLFSTLRGVGGVVASEAGLVEVIMPSDASGRDGVLERIAARHQGAEHGNTFSEEAARQLERYFSGEHVAFAVTIDTSIFTSFQKRVYNIVAGIPPGSVKSYGQVAAESGNPRAARGVGAAMAHNPLPIIIPCHRVVGAQGGLTGYSAPGGIMTKAWLLNMERQNCDAEGLKS